MKDNIIESFIPEDEMTRFGFISHMEDYIKQLLKDLTKAKVDDYLLSHGIDSPKALELLLKRTDPSDENSAVLIRTEKIRPEELSDEDIANGIKPKDKFFIKYKLPRKDYMKKMRNLFISLMQNHVVDNEIPSEIKVERDDDKINFSFGKNGQGLSDELTQIGKEVEKLSQDNNVYIEKAQIDSLDDVYDITVRVFPKEENVNEEEKKYKPKMLDEDGEGGGEGATSADASGQFSQPLFGKPIKRTIYLTKEQYEYLKEAVEMDTAFGDFGYDAPCLKKKKDPAYDHNKMMEKSWNNGKGEKKK